MPLVFLNSHISSENFLCDCQLKWLPPWLLGRTLQASVTATCAHPEALKGLSIFSVPPESFVCGKTVFVTFPMQGGEPGGAPHCGSDSCDRVKPQPVVTSQLLDAAYFPPKPHIVFTAQSPRYVVLRVHAFNQKGAWGGSITNQNNQLQEDS